MKNGWITTKHGDRIHYVNDFIHRDDGPAEIWPDGSTFWCKNSLFHREDGPAFNYINGLSKWYIDGKQINCKDNEEFLRIIKFKAFW